MYSALRVRGGRRAHFPRRLRRAVLLGERPPGFRLLSPPVWLQSLLGRGREKSSPVSLRGRHGRTGRALVTAARARRPPREPLQRPPSRRGQPLPARLGPGLGRGAGPQRGRARTMLGDETRGGGDGRGRPAGRSEPRGSQCGAGLRSDQGPGSGGGRSPGVLCTQLQSPLWAAGAGRERTQA